MIKWRSLNSYESRLDQLRKLDAYTLLGVPRGVSRSELAKAYKKKVVVYHPDKTDPFLRDFGEEYLKLINAARDQVMRELDG